MQGNDQEYVLKVAREHNVRVSRLWFTDILGFLKSVAVTTAQLEDALENGVSFDGSSIQGFARREESDMRALRTRPPSSSSRGGRQSRAPWPPSFATSSTRTAPPTRGIRAGSYAARSSAR